MKFTRKRSTKDFIVKQYHGIDKYEPGNSPESNGQHNLIVNNDHRDSCGQLSDRGWLKTTLGCRKFPTPTIFVVYVIVCLLTHNLFISGLLVNKNRK